MIVFVLRSRLARYPEAGAPTGHLLRDTRVGWPIGEHGKGPRRGWWVAYCGLESLKWVDDSDDPGELLSTFELPRGIPVRRCVRCEAAIRGRLQEWDRLEEWRRR